MSKGGAGRNTPAPSSRTRRVDVREWAGGIRFSAFTGIMMGLVVLAVFVLLPTVGTYLGQRQQIAALQHSVKLTTEQVADLEKQKDRWSDPAYVTSEARARLYYVRPGEVVYLVDDDLPASSLPPEQEKVSEDVTETRADWMSQLVKSVTTAGLSQTASSPADTPVG